MQLNLNIKPHIGIGQILFGMSPEQVAKIAPVDHLGAEKTDAGRLDAVEQMINTIGNMLSDEAKQNLRRNTKKNLRGVSERTGSIGDGGLILDYEDNKLVLIQAFPKIGKVKYEETNLFSENPGEILSFFEENNKEHGRYFKNFSRFDNLAIELTGFSIVRDEKIFPHKGEERIVAIRQKAYIPEEWELENHVRHSFL